MNEQKQAPETPGTPPSGSPAPSNRLAIVGALLSTAGIYSIFAAGVFGIFTGIPVGGVLCLVGMIVSFMALFNWRRHLAIAGMVIGVCGTVYFALLFVNLDELIRPNQRKNRMALNQVRAFGTPLEIFKMDMGRYPTTEQGLNALRTQPADLQDPSKWQGPYLRKDMPLDPWGNVYNYESHEGKCKVFSSGPDGEPYTEDDVT